MAEVEAHASALDAGATCVSDPAAAVAGLKARMARVRLLCEARQVDAVDGGRTDTETLWPSEVLAALDGGSELER